MTDTNQHWAIVNVVGLTPELLGEHTPNLCRLADRGFAEPLQGVFPALTTTAQSSMLTGLTPSQHGIVGNGWYDRDSADVMFWKQSNALVKGDKVWQNLGRQYPNFTCSKLFWWYNMYASVDSSITPRPHYPADGRKIIDLYSTPEGLHQSLEESLGKFPFFNFWGPKAGIESSRWIADAAMLEHQQNSPHLQLVYLPHLDYSLQKFGVANNPHIADELSAIDKVVGDLIDFYDDHNVNLLVVSEYGIDDVEQPVHLNRVLRENGYINVRKSLSWELLDYGASRAFAVADHQVAHVYVANNKDLSAVKSLLEKIPGVARVLDAEGKRELNIDHARAGDLVVIADKNTWFTYYYWMDDAVAPDFARTVDIHRKPGYDPVEMFVDPSIRFPMAKVVWRLLQKKIGMRMLMDVIPLDASLIRGSHGRLPDDPDKGAIIIGPSALADQQRSLNSDVTGNKSTFKMTDISRLVQAGFAR